MLQHVYASVNRSLAAAWLEVVGAKPGEPTVPSVPVVYGHPAPPESLPAECLRLYWLGVGEDTRRADAVTGLVQVDLLVPANNVRLALTRAAELGRRWGLTLNAAPGRCAIYDDAGTAIAEASVTAIEPRWTDADDPAPGVVHLVRTLRIYATPMGL